MSQQVSAVPAGRGAVTAYLTVQGAKDAIAFYQQVFDAKELFRLADPNGRVGHAELQIGSGVIYICDEYPDMDVRGPLAIGGSPVLLHLYVEDVDAVVKRAVAHGATIVRPVEDQFYGDRGGKLRDPYGHLWWIASHKEDLAPDELRARAQKLFGVS